MQEAFELHQPGLHGEILSPKQKQKEEISTQTHAVAV
jgi:hypothetical protein